MNELGQFAAALAMGGALIALLVGPIGQAWARRLSGGKDPAGTTTGEMTAVRIAELEHRLLELEAAHARIAELEERLDFAERLLAQPGAPAERRELPAGESP